MESTIHALGGCPFVLQVWSLSYIWLKLNPFNGFAFGGLFFFAATQLTIDKLNIFDYVVWCLWGARNKLIFENYLFLASSLMGNANCLLGDFIGRQALVHGPSSSSDRDKHLVPPKSSKLKLNTKLAFR